MAMYIPGNYPDWVDGMANDPAYPPDMYCDWCDEMLDDWERTDADEYLCPDCWAEYLEDKKETDDES